MSQSELLEKPIVIFSYPRTASNLFMRILSLENQQNVVSDHTGKASFLPAMKYMRETQLLDKTSDQWTKEQKQKLKSTLQECFDQLESQLNAARAAGKTLVVKDHAPFVADPSALATFIHGQASKAEEDQFLVRIPEKYYSTPLSNDDLPPNETCLPGEFLRACFPTFLIRHPALAFPSYYRMMLSIHEGDQDKMERVDSAITAVMSLKWSRMLFDWYIKLWEQNSQGADGLKPIVMDADDILANPEVVGQFCDMVGLDSTKLRFSWAPGATEEVVREAQFRLVSRSTLFSSSGIVPGKTSAGIALESEFEKFKNEFGDAVGQRLEGAVRDAMPDYEYLRSHKLSA